MSDGCYVTACIKQYLRQRVNKGIHDNVLASVTWSYEKIILELLFLSFPVNTYECCCRLDVKRQTRVDLFVLSCCIVSRRLYYLHERCGLHGMKQTYSQMLVFIVHCYQIKADDFRHSQQDRNNPNQSYFDYRPHWNPDAFDSIPGYYSSVSAKSMGKWNGFGDFFLCNYNIFFKNISRTHVKQIRLLDEIQ